MSATSKNIMHILYFLGSDTTSPSETFIRKSIADLRLAGMSVTVVSGRRSGRAQNVIYSGFSSTTWSLKLWRLFAFLSQTKVNEAYQKWGFSIRQRTASRRLNRFTRIEADFIWFDYLNYACYAEQALHKFNVPFAVAVHGFDASQALASKPLQCAARSLDARFFVSPSNHLKRRLQLIGVERPIHVVPYDSAQASESAKSIEYDFIALGRLTEKKCPQATLMAFEKVLAGHPDARLIWVGFGELKEEMKQRFSHLVDSGNLIFTGAVDHERALELLQASKIFVQHSVTSGLGDQEGLPNSIVEAMRHGKPVISTIHSGIPELITHGKNGFLAQEHDFESFAEHMILLLEDGKLRKEMGVLARESVAERIPLGSRGKEIRSLILNQVNGSEE
tara:strand:- start:547 stop:1722 length:1176 start_codon:yes stop_codon:yes gene_type:complete